MTGIGRDRSLLERRGETGPAVGACASGIAGGRHRSPRKAGAYVTRDLVMKRSNMANTKHFRTIARYLEEQGWIAEADYGVFVVTTSGIAEATR